MKFEIRDPSSIDGSERPWPTAILEELPVSMLSFVPLMNGADGTPHPTEDGGFSMAMVGNYQLVEKPMDVWTIEIASLEELIQGFSDFVITITETKVVGCVGLLEFEEPPSTFLSCS